MPRDGSNIYSQPFPDVVEDTTIESTVYNGFTNDVAQDLNAPRPVVAGGTGAASAVDARFNLATEVATQTVTNYDSHVWTPGSFRSASSASGQPVASHAFAGWCYIGEALANPPTNQNVVVHAYDFDALANTALLYTRQKKAGVWSDWNITTTADNQAGARQAIYAAPFDALAYNGMQVNGSMEVSQANGASAVGPNVYTVDGWMVYSSGAHTAAVVCSQDVTVPTGFATSLRMVSPTANVTPASSDFLTFAQKIEGYRVNRLWLGYGGAASITVAFWVRSNMTGTYSGAARNGAASNRCYTFLFTVTAVDTFEYKTVTIPGDTSGTWATGNTSAFEISFSPLTGSGQRTAPNVWTAGGFLGATGATTGIPSNFNMYITGVVVLPGIEAPSAARSPLIMRPYSEELLTCQRYWERQEIKTLSYSASNSVAATWPYKVTKRTAGIVGYADFAGTTGKITVFSTNGISITAGGFLATITGLQADFVYGGTLGTWVGFNATTDARL